MRMSERQCSMLGVASALLAFLLTLIGIVLTQVLPTSPPARAAGLTLVVLAGGFVILVMVYSCIALKRNYKLFSLYSLGEPELRTDLKRRVLATTDPVPENLTALAAVSSVTSQGNTLRNVPYDLGQGPSSSSAAAAAVAAMRADDSRLSEEEAEPEVDAVVPEMNAANTSTLTSVSTTWRKGVTFRTPTPSTAWSETPGDEDEAEPPTPEPAMPVYETIDRTAAEARSFRDDPSDAASLRHDDGRDSLPVGLLPAHYVGTEDDRIEEFLAERPATPSDGSGSIQEAIYDAAEEGPEPEVELVDMSGRHADYEDAESVQTSSLMGNMDDTGSTQSRLERMRGLNLLRRKEFNKDFNTYENATARRGRYYKRGARRSGLDDASDAGSQFDNVSEIGEVDIPHERVSVAPSDLSYPESLPSQVDSNLLF